MIALVARHHGLGNRAAGEPRGGAGAPPHARCSAWCSASRPGSTPRRSWWPSARAGRWSGPATDLHGDHEPGHGHHVPAAAGDRRHAGRREQPAPDGPRGRGERPERRPRRVVGLRGARASPRWGSRERRGRRSSPAGSARWPGSRSSTGASPGSACGASPGTGRTTWPILRIGIPSCAQWLVRMLAYLYLLRFIAEAAPRAGVGVTEAQAAFGRRAPARHPGPVRGVRVGGGRRHLRGPEPGLGPPGPGGPGHLDRPRA